jgi:hypothetical protein
MPARYTISSSLTPISPSSGVLVGHLEVEFDVLTGLARDLKSVGQAVSSARQGLDDLGEGQTGDRDLSSAVHDFTDKWKYSLEKIGKTADEVGQKVSGAAEGYTTTEQAIVDAERGSA